MKKEIIIMGVLSCVFTLVGVGTGMFIQTKITESRVRNIKKYLWESGVKKRIKKAPLFRKEMFPAKIFEDLNLTPQQREELKKILQQQKEKTAQLFKGLKTHLEEIKKETQKKISQILTEEQKQHLKERFRKKNYQGRDLGRKILEE